MCLLTESIEFLHRASVNYKDVDSVSCPGEMMSHGGGSSENNKLRKMPNLEHIWQNSV